LYSYIFGHLEKQSKRGSALLGANGLGQHTMALLYKNNCQ